MTRTTPDPRFAAGVREALVRQAGTELSTAASTPTGASSRPPVRPRAETVRVALVTAVVLIAIVAGSVVALRAGVGRADPAVTGPSPSVTGVPLGRWTSAAGVVQTHQINPNGLALSYQFTCSGPGSFSLTFNHTGGSGGTGGCSGGGSGTEDRARAGTVTVRLRAAKTMAWTLAVFGVPETYVTPSPVARVTGSAGPAIPFCTSDDLMARYEAIGRRGAGWGQLTFTNTSASICALAGWPSVVFLDGEKPLGDRSRQMTDERQSAENGLKPVLLQPQGEAYVQVGYYPLTGSALSAEQACAPLQVHAIRIDLSNPLAAAGQHGTIDTTTERITACRNGFYGKYAQIGATMFVDYRTR